MGTADPPGLATAGRGRGGVPGATTLRGLAVGGLGTAALAALLAPGFGPLGVAAALAVGAVWWVLGGPFGYALGQVLVATVLPVPLDAPAFLPVQGALLSICFGRLFAAERPLPTVVAAAGSVVVVGALLVVSLGSVASLWQPSLLVVGVAAVATVFVRWYEPSDAPVDPEASR
jgi:hypothetical protein